MEDNSVESCFSCNVEFKLLMRRHHCRLCGHIFCFNCAGRFVPGELIGSSGKRRLCDFCFDIVSRPVYSLNGCNILMHLDGLSSSNYEPDYDASICCFVFNISSCTLCW